MKTYRLFSSLKQHLFHPMKFDIDKYSCIIKLHAICEYTQPQEVPIAYGRELITCCEVLADCETKLTFTLTTSN